MFELPSAGFRCSLCSVVQRWLCFGRSICCLIIKGSNKLIQCIFLGRNFTHHKKSLTCRNRVLEHYSTRKISQKIRKFPKLPKSQNFANLASSEFSPPSVCGRVGVGCVGWGCAQPVGCVGGGVGGVSGAVGLPPTTQPLCPPRSGPASCDECLAVERGGPSVMWSG